MPTLHKQSCPTCGQSVNERQIGLFKGMVEALKEVYKWCQEKNLHEFSRKDIKHLLKNDNQIARFGDWVMFGGLVYKQGKGHYGLNMERTRDFFAGKYEIPTVVYKNPLNDELRLENYKTIDNIPGLEQYLDNNQEYVVKYSSPESSQQAISWMSD